MKIIKHSDIVALQILPKCCNEWIEFSFKKKNEALLPVKTSISLEGDIFFNTMPCCLPSLGCHCVKQINRFPENSPALEGTLLLHRATDGNLIAIMDATWITTMRTGATAALVIEMLKKDGANKLSIVGLGNTSIASVLCLLEYNTTKHWYIKLLRYKDHTERFVERFSEYDNVSFEIVDTNKELIKGAEVLLSCVTVADKLFGEDVWFDEGILVVPVHTKGFQNCDLFFDKVIVDDIGNVEKFKYFNQFKKIAEVSDVLKGSVVGRENNQERILAYNIGIGIHDLVFASKIYEMSQDKIHDASFKESIMKYFL